MQRSTLHYDTQSQQKVFVKILDKETSFLFIRDARTCYFQAHIERQCFMKGFAVGSCADNAAAESSFGVLRRE